MLDVRSSFHAELVEDAHEVAELQGYDLVLSTVTRTRGEQRAVETLVDSRCEGLILLGPDAPAAELAALDMLLPVVAVGRGIPAAGLDVVRVADDEGVAQAVGHLVQLGHTAITYVDGGRGMIARHRRRGYQKTMRRHGLAGRVRVVGGDHTEEAGSAAAGALLGGSELPTAVVTYNDSCAVGLLDGLLRAGVDVPGEISVVGYDDSPLSRLAHVNLTTVGQYVRGLTEHAVAALVERLDGGRSEHREVVLSPRLVVRGTSGPVRPS